MEFNKTKENMIDEIEPTPKKYDYTKENMITRTKLFESNLQMGREIYFMKDKSKVQREKS